MAKQKELSNMPERDKVGVAAAKYLGIRTARDQANEELLKAGATLVIEMQNADRWRRSWDRMRISPSLLGMQKRHSSA